MTEEGENRINELLAANVEFAKTWHNTLQMKDMRARGTVPILVLTCMDPRVIPEQFFGPGQRLAVFRNAGGRCTPDTVRTVAVLRTLRYSANDIKVMVVHHTDCGMTSMTTEDIEENIRARTGRSSDSVTGIDFGVFTTEDLDKSVAEDVQKLRAEELLKGTDVRGYVLDTVTGLLRELKI